ncbi:hypothetical protein E1B28_000843 [Marasmius oreades]|nr:uncharacterized protein E1B28_000843 [Marasmius oreades]KAG7098953.1 hypothetical protein E1B28_000843 [Marasmius oreades]
MIELGPGRGTLMADMLRVITQLTRTMKAQVQVQVHLVENSSAMRAMQQKRLGKQGNLEIQWHASIDSIPPSGDIYTMLMAHEFFDALPFHVLKRTEEGWHEVLISSSSFAEPPLPEPQSSVRYPCFYPVLTPAPTPISTLLGTSSPRFQSIPVGSFLEVSPVAFKIAHKIGELLRKGGCGLIIDYGGDTFYDNSRRAFKDHKIVDFFHRPGECDLTANVDFAYLKEAVEDSMPVYKPLTQSHFLQAMGLKERLLKLMKNHRTRDPEKAKRIEEAALRLVSVSPDGGEMGNQYSVMGISSNDEQSYPFIE